MTLLLVALGAAVGAPLRYLTGKLLPTQRFPWATLTVNIAGSLLLGFLIGLPVSPGLAALLGTGFCGALTTYSTFSHETLTLARTGRQPRAIAYVTLSILAGLGAAYLGILLGAALTA
ncbi:fluoride efflux transporter CrcB [Actinoplanes sp. NPDC051494]|uniref:fluoride efflux transporter CrcB n=1 Tax=Actinoplanes sp. NPDC051494 TaxID=3363907 RepID=UPI00379EAB60